MPGRIAILATSIITAASFSGVVLGNYATTTKQHPVDATDARYLGQASEDAETGYASSYPPDTPDLAPTHIPVCRKGCGPTLSERQAAAYFDDGYAPLDRIYADIDKDYLADSYSEEPAAPDPQPVPVATPPPRLVLGSTPAPCDANSVAPCTAAGPAAPPVHNN